MKTFFCLFLGLGFFVSAFYLLLPSPSFPPPPPGSLQSTEPSDTESPYRRAYFTNLSRNQVMEYYSQVFTTSNSPIPLLQFRLNYPPEESYSLIRDQTRSSWLEELVHPLRESLYINGFYPTKPTEQIIINGNHYLNKITVRLMPSHPVTRLTVLGLISLASYFLFKSYLTLFPKNV